MKSRKILILTTFYLPGFKAGGPIKSIANIVEHLGDDFEFYIVTKNSDLGSENPYDGIVPGEWGSVGKARVMYVVADQFGMRDFSRLVSEVDPCVFYLNSFFDQFFSIRFLLWRFFSGYRGNVLLAPRGEFSKGALALKSWKKKVYISLVKPLGLLRGVVFHASSFHEACDIKKGLSLVDDSIHVALDLPAVFNQSSEIAASRHIEVSSPLRLVFLSRISPMKNLDYIISCLTDVTAPLVFDIYGPAEDAEYWSECEKLISSLPSHIKVSYFGAVNPHETVRIFSSYDLFFFPTRGENYGHVIAESLSVGTPVLISDQTPWLDLDKDGTGWALPLSSKFGFVEKIEYLASLSPELRRAMRQDVLQGARNRILNPQHVEDNRHMFQELCGLND